MQTFKSIFLGIIQGIILTIGIILALPWAILRAIYYTAREYSFVILKDIFQHRIKIITQEELDHNRKRNQEKDTTHHEHRDRNR